MKNNPRMTQVEELKMQLTALRQERDQIANQNNAKKLAAMKAKKTFQASVIDLAKMMVVLRKTRELDVKNK